MTPFRSVLVAPLAAITVIAVAILLFTGGSARAATPTYADPAGTCASLTPCYTTVQDAVNNAGPAPAVINIFPGTYSETVDLSGMNDSSPGDITLQAVDAGGAPAIGTATINAASAEAIWESFFPFPGKVTINGLILTSTFDSIVDLSATGDVTYSDNQASNGSSDGVYLESEGNVTVTNSSFNSNSSDGLTIDAGLAITLTDSTANDNDNGGFELSTPEGNVTITGSTANGNTDSEGFDIETYGDVSISGTEASGNYNEGIEIDGYDGGEAGDVTITDVTANDNGDDGIDVEATNVTITNATANGNEDEGIQTLISDTTLIDRATTLGNLSDGLDIEGAESKGFFTNSVTIINSYLADNQETGVEFLEDPTFVEGTLLTNSNVICGNVEAGYESFDDAASNAEGNWWGAATGPTHPSNPAGTGDDVLDGTNSELGTVDFDPFISTSSGSGSATVGLASAISFQFTGPGGTPALQEGPGDETGASPFTVTTDNGTATVGFITDGKLDVSLTAATVGTANVSVTGPCGLATATLPVSVAAAVGTPVATPVQLPDTGGAAHSNSIPLTAVVALSALAMLLLSAAGFAWSRAR